MKRACQVLSVVLLLTVSVLAQMQLQQGFLPSQSYHTLDFDTVNLSNGNLILHIPVVSYPQRGAMPDLSIFLAYNGMNWNPIHDYNPDGSDYFHWTFDGLGVRPSFSPFVNIFDFQEVKGFWSTTFTYPYAVDPIGGRHLLAPNSLTGQWLAVDQSGYALLPASNEMTIADKAGIQHHTCVYNCGQQYQYSRDANDNRITTRFSSGPDPRVTGWTDTIGRIIPAPLGLRTRPMPQDDAYYGSIYAPGCEATAFPSPSNGAALYTFCYGQYDVASHFNDNFYQDDAGIFWGLSSVVLPNGRSWQFNYDAYGGWGDLTTVGLPTGGTVTYTWTSVHTVDNGTFQIWQRRVASRTVNPGGQAPPETWYYSYSDTLTSQPKTTETDPAGNVTVHVFDQTGAETQTLYYSGPSSPSNLLKTVTREFVDAGGFSYYEDYMWHGRKLLKKETTSWPNGQVSARCAIHDNNINTGCATTGDNFESNGPTTHDPNRGADPTVDLSADYDLVVGSQLYAYDYDYGLGSSGSLLRKTETNYLWQQNSSYLNANLMDRVASVTIREPNGVLAAQTTYAYDESGRVPSGCSSTTPCGLQTSVTRENGSTDPATLTTYNSQGMPTQGTDPGGHTTQYSYDSSGMFVNQITYPTTGSTSHVESFGTDFNTGLRTSFTDQNGKITFYTYNSMRRIVSVSYPDGGGTSWNYHSDPIPPQITRTIEADPDPDQVLITRFDSLGRVSQTEQSDPEGDDYVNTSISFDLNQHVRIECVSNPFRSGTPAQTCTHRDALGRVIKTVKQDGGEVLTSYSGACATVTDEAGRKRKSCTDGLGRVTEVREDPDGGNYPTVYTYDVLDNLKKVEQKGNSGTSSDWRTRIFDYDKLSRLISAANPESGTVSYTYDADGNVLTKTVPAPNQTGSATVTTTYSYDELHRLRTAYPSDLSPSGGTPSRLLHYDLSQCYGRSLANTNGRLACAYTRDYAGNETTVQVYSYDSLGRLSGLSQCGSTNCSQGIRDVAATYDKAGQLSFLTYPSGRKITQAYSSAARTTSVIFDSFGGTAVNYAYWNAAPNVADPGYNADGSMRKASMGNGVTEQINQNSRLQPERMWLSGPGSAPWMDRSYNWHHGNGDNGNVWAITDSVNPARSQTFTYDNLNRILTAEESGAGGWGQSFTVDPWGNLTNIGNGPNRNTPYILNQAPAATTNRLASLSYDSAGNVTNDGHAYTYDAENRMVAVDSTAAAYTYYPDGQRARKDVGGDWTEYVYFNGQVIAEHKPNGDWSDYVYAGGKRIARADNYEDRVLIQGTNCSNCGYQYTIFDLPGYSCCVIQSGDRLVFRQWQSSGARGGITMWFTDTTNTNWNTYDQDSEQMNNDSFQQQWHYRSIDLSQHAGKIVGQISFVVDYQTSPGPWAIYYQDVILVRADGTVLSFYSRNTDLTLAIRGTTGVSNRSYSVDHDSNAGPYSHLTATTYYHGDHLGSARMQTSENGYPVWSATYLPYGYEMDPQSTENHYKFTAKERDSESGLDYFGARHYASTVGRFMQPDEPFADQDPSDPQSWNLYSYVRNNPLNSTDPDGRSRCVDGNNGGDFTLVCYSDEEWRRMQAQQQAQQQAERALMEMQYRQLFDQNPYAIGVFSQPVLGYARGTVNNYIAPPLLAFLSFAAPGLLVDSVITPGFEAAANAKLASQSLSSSTAFNVGKGVLNGETTGFVQHALNRVLVRGVTRAEIEEALTHVPKGTGGSVLRFIGKNAEVRVNQVTGKIVTVIRFSGPN